MKPRLLRSELTGRVYVVTRYKVDPKSGLIQAQAKHDVTDEFNALSERANSGANPDTESRPLGAVHSEDSP